MLSCGHYFRILRLAGAHSSQDQCKHELPGGKVSVQKSTVGSNLCPAQVQRGASHTSPLTWRTLQKSHLQSSSALTFSDLHQGGWTGRVLSAETSRKWRQWLRVKQIYSAGWYVSKCDQRHLASIPTFLGLGIALNQSSQKWGWVGYQVCGPPSPPWGDGSVTKVFAV